MSKLFFLYPMLTAYMKMALRYWTMQIVLLFKGR